MTDTSVTASGNLEMLAAEAIRRGQEAIAYYVREQGWSEAYARDHAKVVFLIDQPSEEELREILAQKYEAAGLEYQAAVVRKQEHGASSHEVVLTIILDAMREAATRRSKAPAEA